MLAARADGAPADGPPIPSPLVNGTAVARVLQGLPSPLVGARDWRMGAGGGEDGLWGRWAGWDFGDVAAVADRVVLAFGRA